MAATAATGQPARAGLQIGECERLDGERVAGAAVEGARRLAAAAAPGTVLLTRDLTNLVVGSGLTFVDRGERELDGVPGRLSIEELKPAADGSLEGVPRNPALARPVADSLTAAQRLSLAVAERAPGVARTGWRAVGGVVRRVRS